MRTQNLWIFIYCVLALFSEMHFRHIIKWSERMCISGTSSTPPLSPSDGVRVTSCRMTSHHKYFNCSYATHDVWAYPAMDNTTNPNRNIKTINFSSCHLIWMLKSRKCDSSCQPHVGQRKVDSPTPTPTTTATSHNSNSLVIFRDKKALDHTCVCVCVSVCGARVWDVGVRDSDVPSNFSVYMWHYTKYFIRFYIASCIRERHRNAIVQSGAPSFSALLCAFGVALCACEHC